MKNNKKISCSAVTFRAIANCDKYSRNVSILKLLLGINLFGVVALFSCNVMGVFIPYYLGITIASLVGCVTEFTLLSYNHYCEKVATKLKERFATKVQAELLGSGKFVEGATFKLQRFSPVDNMEMLTMSANVGDKSSSQKATVSCDKKVGSFIETYRVSHGNKNETLGFCEVVTNVEPSTKIFGGSHSCVQTVTTSKPKYSYKFIPKGNEQLSKLHEFELKCLEAGKSPTVEKNKIRLKKMFSK